MRNYYPYGETVALLTVFITTGPGLPGTHIYKSGTQTVTSNNYQQLDTFTIAPPPVPGMPYAMDEHPHSRQNDYRLMPISISNKQFTIDAPGITVPSCLPEMTEINGQRAPNNEITEPANTLSVCY